jgi:hypothetical protein
MHRSTRMRVTTLSPPQAEGLKHPLRLRREGGGGGQYSFTRGQKTYELTNHLGNVMAVVRDTKVAVSSNGATTADYYLAHVISALGGRGWGWAWGAVTTPSPSS